MSATTTAPKTAAAHTAAELTFLSADTTGIVAYTAPSASTPGKVNTVSLDTATGDTHCDCRASECGRGCWHVALVGQSWDAEAARLEVVWLTDAQLVRYGTKAAHMVVTYQARIGRSRIEDRIALLVARAEYRRRVRLGPIERDTPTPDATRTRVPASAPMSLPAYVARQARRAAAQRAYVGQVMATAPRQATATTAREALIAIVTAWESLSYSDRHIDQHVDGRRGERACRQALAALAAPLVA